MISEVISRCRHLHAQDLYIRKDCPCFYAMGGKILKLDDVKITETDIEEFFKDTAPDSAKDILDLKGWARYSCRAGEQPGAKSFARVDVVLEGRSKGLTLRLMPDSVPGFPSTLGQAFPLDILTKGRGIFILSGKSSCGKTTFLSSLIDHLNSKESLRILEITDAIAFHHECKNSFIRQIEIMGFQDLMTYALKTSWDLVAIDALPDMSLMESALRIAENQTKVILTATASSATRALEGLNWLFPDHERQEKRERLSRVLDGVMYIEPQWLPEGKAALAAEVLVATQSVRNLLRDAKFKEISDSIAAGQKYGMQTLESSISDLRQRGLIFS